MTFPFCGIAGGEHTLYKSKNGSSLESTGACGLGWCRLESLNPSLFKFRNVTIPEPVSLIHASYYHNLAVGKLSGSLYSWGCGTFVEGGLDGVIPALGQGKEARDIGGGPKVVKFTPKLNLNEKIKAITGGAYHSAVLLNTGRIFTFGSGQLGQLGRPIIIPENNNANDERVDSSGLPVDPEPVMAVIPNTNLNGADEKEKGKILIQKIGSGFYNTFAICKRGKLFCTGENQNQQCGVGSKNLHTFAQVTELDNHEVDQVDGGYCHTLVKTLSGKVFSLGCGDDGQRGDSSKDIDDLNRPILNQVDLPVKVKQVAAGANHSVILGLDGNAYSFGANDVGQCGVASDHIELGNDREGEEEGEELVKAPKKIDLPTEAGKVIHVSAGYAHTVLTTDSGLLFTFGQNDNGQLGLGADDVTLGKEPEPQKRPIKVCPRS